jgi:aconitate hydratase
VLARSFERIHRSNLVGMGILPLQFEEGESAETLGLSGRETFDVVGLESVDAGAPLPSTLTVHADGRAFTVRLRIDTPTEAEHLRHGGILQFVLRTLGSHSAAVH